jgi:CPA1 family monovalent cation:H+ antiporter
MEHLSLASGLALLLLIAALSVLAQRMKVSSPLLMLVAGIALAFVPGVPAPTLHPNLIFLGLLPPLLYTSGVNMSWRGFRSNLRPILMLAIGCVIFTASAVAVVGHLLLGLPWVIGFLLGSIVSPPDAVAPTAFMRGLSLPRRLTTILEGESLINDATALVIFGFALSALATGSFSIASASVKFIVIVCGETAFGILVAWAMLHLRDRASDTRAEVLLALATPFIAFWPPRALGGSGVVACVAAGLWVSWNGRRLIRPATRLQGYFIWDLVTWVIEALVFLLTGLQARAVVGRLSGTSWRDAIVASLFVTATVIVVRFTWVYSATYASRLLPGKFRSDPSRDWQQPFVISYAGLRGVVSLAAALSLPLMIGGYGFPQRDLVLFVTFAVITFTLLGLGTTLAPLVRALGIARIGLVEAISNKRAERAVRLEGVMTVLEALKPIAGRTTPGTALEALCKRHADRRAQLTMTADITTSEDPVSDTGELQLRLLEIERAAITRAYEENRITDEARRRIERELDLEEARERHILANVGITDNESTG